MPIFGDLSSKFLNINVRFEISTFEIGYRQNFAKIRKLIIFDPKCPYLGIWAQNFQIPMSDLKSAQSKYSAWKILLKRLESWYFLTQNAQICTFGLKIFKKQCQIWNSHLWTKVQTKFHWKIILNNWSVTYSHSLGNQ